MVFLRRISFYEVHYNTMAIIVYGVIEQAFGLARGVLCMYGVFGQLGLVASCTLNIKYLLAEDHQ